MTIAGHDEEHLARRRSVLAFELCRDGRAGRG